MRIKLIVPLLLLLSGLAWSAPPPELRQIAVIDLPGQPGFDEMAFAKGMLLITHAGAGTVDIFDPAKRRLIAHVKDMGRPQGITVDEQGGRVYIGDSGTRSIVVLSTDDWRVLQSIPMNGAPKSLLLVPDAHAVMVVYGDKNAIGALDTVAQREVASTELDGRPSYVASDAGRKLIYATLQDKKQVVAIDRQMRIVKRFPLNASLPTGIAFDARQDKLYVAVRYALLALNADSGEEVARVPAPGGLDALVFDDANGRVLAAAGGAVFSVKTNGSFKADEMATAVKGHTLAYDPQKKMVYMPGGLEGRSKLLILKQIGTAQILEETQSAKK